MSLLKWALFGFFTWLIIKGRELEQEKKKWTVIFVIQRVLGAMIQSVIIVMEQVDVQIHIPVVVGSGKIEMSELCL